MTNDTILAKYVQQGIEHLYSGDPTLYGLLYEEYHRQANVLTMVAASSVVDPSVLICDSMVPVNVTAEGYPGARFHAGCKVIDKIEQLAIDRAKEAFGAQYANVQSHSATTANQVVMCRLLKPGDTLLGMELNSGGHLTHGSKASVSGQYFNAIGYGLENHERIDYERVHRLAQEHMPKLIICGTTAYPRIIDFERFREIADEVGAYVLADITHIAGLIIAGLHPSPIDHVHFTTTCTHKQIYGPRGGLIMMGKDYDRPAPDGKGKLFEVVQKGVFPFFQGAPNLNSIAAKAKALGMVLTPEFKERMKRIVADARALARCFMEMGYHVITGGSDNHLVVVDVISNGITGLVAEKALEDCNIVVNKNRIPGDQQSAFITSGIRIGTNSLALKGMGPEEMPMCAELIHRVLSSVRPLDDRTFELDKSVKTSIRAEVAQICKRFPIPCYPYSGESVEKFDGVYGQPMRAVASS
ncbi:serine hydroxymethyltransferase [candidate division KSB1 bacterium]|nr:serine hydroxymethyltransferase [candidate division KSB1 bacterium]NIV70981.1 serine hydroxymethyltransferase [Phycisphaerae bacterium]NIR73111.1 serine hydroxymethyltransferase [candidate division KSB1 bacterium]NIT75205.1 serine hydroxymethyltransferase [candidate division KSB1 bacterium]NIU29044.1 serine hydroxymethyltransferase [candidate division KSB1 bacterium]